MKVSRRSTDEKATLITSAEPSLTEQFNARRKKYVIMMSTRVLCLILAASFYHIPWLMGIFVAGAVVLPWAAVLVANDRPPKQASKLSRFKPGARMSDHQIAPATTTALPRGAAAQEGARVVDMED